MAEQDGIMEIKVNLTGLAEKIFTDMRKMNVSESEIIGKSLRLWDMLMKGEINISEDRFVLDANELDRHGKIGLSADEIEKDSSEIRLKVAKYMLDKIYIADNK